LTVEAPTAASRLDHWFTARGWRPFDFQRAVWQAHLAGESGLLHSATGTGKTLAALFGTLLAAGDMWDVEVPLTLLWITPMRALAADTRESLAEPLAQMGCRWTVGLRTGDTAASERARQDRRMPSVLVTTPESLSLLLARHHAEAELAHLCAVVVDEWHELLGNKRGVQTQLCLARLRRWRPALRTWALSATLGNLDEALACLTGGRPGRLIEGANDKALTIDTLIPADMQRFPWAGHTGLAMLDEVVAAIAESGTTLIFANVRSQAEIWFQALLAARPDWAGVLALHHGSLDLAARRFVERGLKAGTLRAVVTTSSLDLGVDFSPVERVLQLGSAKGVARLLQRAGRSGHQPGAHARVTCVPTQALEFVESAAARRAAASGRIEARTAPYLPLDVLTQHMVTLALGAGFEADALFDEVRAAWSYRTLSRGEFQWALDFVTRGGPLAAYPEFRRVTMDGGRYRVRDARIARLHRMSVGTIVSEASMEVRFMNGQRLGVIEESFIAWLDKGDAFTFAGRVLELVRVENLTAYVRPSRAKRALTPRWAGGKMPLSSELADTTREMLDAARRGAVDAPELRAVSRLLALQQDWSRLPAPDEVLVETFQTRDGHHAFCYPFGGRQVHTGLAALSAYRLGRERAGTFSLGFNDYGFELLSAEPFDFVAAIGRGLFSLEALEADLLASLNAAELAKRHFREIARVAGLVHPGYPGSPRSNKQLQASASLVYEVFAKWDPENPLLAQAQREVLDRQLEFARLRKTLERMARSRLVCTTPPKPTPFAFPIMLEQLREKLSTEKLAARIARMQVLFEDGMRAVGGEGR
jgi:ATP-dependent Lhr-like helicase